MLIVIKKNSFLEEDMSGSRKTYYMPINKTIIPLFDIMIVAAGILGFPKLSQFPDYEKCNGCTKNPAGSMMNFP